MAATTLLFIARWAAVGWGASTAPSRSINPDAAESDSDS